MDFAQRTNNQLRPLAQWWDELSFFWQWLHFSGCVFSRKVSPLFTVYPIIFNRISVEGNWVYNDEHTKSLYCVLYRPLGEAKIQDLTNEFIVLN